MHPDQLAAGIDEIRVSIDNIGIGVLFENGSNGLKRARFQPVIAVQPEGDVATGVLPALADGG